MPSEKLTQRETEVLGLIAQGRTSRQIADVLKVSIHTINNHRKHVCRKFGLHSTAELVVFAATAAVSSVAPTALIECAAGGHSGI